MPLALPISLLLTLLITAAADDQRSHHWWLPDHRAAQADAETRLRAVPSAATLRSWHDQLAVESHIAGTPGDRRMIDTLVKAFTDMGLSAQTHEIWPLLARPIEARVAIVQAPTAGPDHHESLPMILPLQEPALPEDPQSAHPNLTMGWNAFSGSDSVTAEVVYANYGRPEDFQRLAELGVDVRGKIVIARYGKLFRGYKAKFAQEAGAAGVLLFTDPADSGYVQGLVWPEGGWANADMIQRGSLLTLDHPGDPLTPGLPATEDADRLNEAEVALPRIPVQPLGYGAADQILSRMRGQAVPKQPDSWQGGLPFTYRVEGGPDLVVELTVRQERAITPTANVIATLPGSRWPEQMIVIGCHHDAWGIGASDPLAGMIVLMETARSLAEMSRQGFGPSRTIVFAAWAAEEFGIIGSTEWCEANEAALRQGAVAYINLDMAAMGPEFHASASPTLRAVIEDATRAVPQARDASGRTVQEATMAAQSKARASSRAAERPDDSAGQNLTMSFATLGGGSDHVAFLCRLGIASCGIGAGGSQGTSYHSNADNLAWYRRIVGEDYEPALMLTRVVSLLALRLANADVLPLEFAVYGPEFREHLKPMRQRAQARRVLLDLELLLRQLDELDKEAALTRRMLDQAIESGRLDDDRLSRINLALAGLEQSWLEAEGLPGRPWFRNTFAGPDPERGYDAWPLPLLRWGVETGDSPTANWTIGLYLNSVQRVGERLADIRQALEPPRTQPAVR